jgi:ankyrin repeat protein
MHQKDLEDQEIEQHFERLGIDDKLKDPIFWFFQPTPGSLMSKEEKRELLKKEKRGLLSALRSMPTRINSPSTESKVGAQESKQPNPWELFLKEHPFPGRPLDVATDPMHPGPFKNAFLSDILIQSGNLIKAIRNPEELLISVGEKIRKWENRSEKPLEEAEGNMVEILRDEIKEALNTLKDFNDTQRESIKSVNQNIVNLARKQRKTNKKIKDSINKESSPEKINQLIKDSHAIRSLLQSNNTEDDKLQAMKHKYEKSQEKIQNIGAFANIMALILFHSGYEQEAEDLAMISQSVLSIIAASLAVAVGTMTPAIYILLLIDGIQLLANAFQNLGSSKPRPFDNLLEIKHLIHAELKQIFQGQSQILDKLDSVISLLGDNKISLREINTKLDQLRNALSASNQFYYENEESKAKSNLEIAYEQLKYCPQNQDFLVSCFDKMMIIYRHAVFESKSPLLSGFTNKSLNLRQIADKVRDHPQISQIIGLLPQIAIYFAQKNDSKSFEHLDGKPIANPKEWTDACLKFVDSTKNNKLVSCDTYKSQIQNMIEVGKHITDALTSYTGVEFRGLVIEEIFKSTKEFSEKIKAKTKRQFTKYINHHPVINMPSLAMKLTDPMNTPNSSRITLQAKKFDNVFQGFQYLEKLGLSDLKPGVLPYYDKSDKDVLVECDWSEYGMDLFTFAQKLGVMKLHEISVKRDSGYENIECRDVVCEVGDVKFLGVKCLRADWPDNVLYDFSQWRSHLSPSEKYKLFPIENKKAMREFGEFVKSMLIDEGNSFQDQPIDDFLKNLLNKIRFTDFVYLLCLQKIQKLKMEAIKSFIKNHWENGLKDEIGKLADEIDLAGVISNLPAAMNSKHFNQVLEAYNSNELTQDIRQSLELTLELFTYSAPFLKYDESLGTFIACKQAKTTDKEPHIDDTLKLFNNDVEQKMQQLALSTESGLIAKVDHAVRCVDEVNDILRNLNLEKIGNEKGEKEDKTSDVLALLKVPDKDPAKHPKNSPDIDKLCNSFKSLAEQLSNMSSIFNSLKLVNQAPINLEARDLDGNTYLHRAVISGSEKEVIDLIKQGADVNTTNGTDQTALHLAAAGGHTIIALHLLDNRANVNAQTSTGQTPLHTATQNGNEEMINLLLAHGADINHLSSDGKGCLFYALGSKAVIEQLLSKGADPNCNEKLPLLHLAIDYDYEDVVKLLLTYGAKIDAVDYFQGLTPEKRAAGIGRQNILAIIRNFNVSNSQPRIK